MDGSGPVLIIDVSGVESFRWLVLIPRANISETININELVCNIQIQFTRN